MTAVSSPPEPSPGPVTFSHTQLVYFVRVAEAGQISRAARMLYMAQPALSQALARLERQLGFELLERHASGVTLTASGEVFLAKAKAALSADAEAVATARSLARSRSGSLEIGFLSSLPTLSAPGVLARFSSAYPEIELFFRELPFPTASTNDWLAEVDIAICHSPRPRDGVQIERLWSEPRAALMHEEHALASRRELAVGEVLGERFCGYNPAVDPAWAAFWTLDQLRGGPPELLTSDRASNAMELIAALAAGHGVSVIPSSVAHTIAGFVPHLAAREVKDAQACECALVWRDPPENSLVMAFVQAARDLAAQEHSDAGEDKNPQRRSAGTGSRARR